MYGWCFKYGGKFVLECLNDCFNQSLEEQTASGNMREAWISPTWKGENKQLPSNYRPIALTNIVSKLLEGIIRDRMISHMIQVGLIDETQHGSISGRSTVTQLIQQQKDILDILENGDNLELIYLDFAKAYDKVNHQILLKKIENMGIKGNTLAWIKH